MTVEPAGHRASLLVQLEEWLNAQGSPMAELHQVLPGLSRKQVRGLMDELRQEGRVELIGKRRGARWVVK